MKTGAHSGVFAANTILRLRTKSVSLTEYIMLNEVNDSRAKQKLARIAQNIRNCLMLTLSCPIAESHGLLWYAKKKNHSVSESNAACISAFKYHETGPGESDCWTRQARADRSYRTNKEEEGCYGWQLPLLTPFVSVLLARAGMETPGIQHFGRIVVLLRPLNSVMNRVSHQCPLTH